MAKLSRPTFETIVNALESFRPETIQDEESRERQSALKHVEASRRLQISEITDKHKHRKWFIGAMIGLLFLQNAAVFILIWRAMSLRMLGDLQAVFSIYTGATLLETGIVIREIVHSVFEKIRYPHQASSGKPREKQVKVSDPH